MQRPRQEKQGDRGGSSEDSTRRRTGAVGRLSCAAGKSEKKGRGEKKDEWQKQEQPEENNEKSPVRRHLNPGAPGRIGLTLLLKKKVARGAEKPSACTTGQEGPGEDRIEQGNGEIIQDYSLSHQKPEEALRSRLRLCTGGRAGDRRGEKREKKVALP